MGCGAAAAPAAPAGEELVLDKPSLRKLERQHPFTWAGALETRKALQVEFDEVKKILAKSEQSVLTGFLEKVLFDLTSLDSVLQNICDDEDARKAALQQFMQSCIDQRSKALELATSRASNPNRTEQIMGLTILQKEAEELLEELAYGLPDDLLSKADAAAEWESKKSNNPKGFQSDRRLMLLKALQWKLENEGRMWFEAEAAKWLNEKVTAKASAAFKKRRQSAQVWLELGLQGGGDKGGQHYSKEACFVRALEIDPKYGAAWQSLAILRGADVGGKSYCRFDCLAKAKEFEKIQNMEIDPKSVNAWDASVLKNIESHMKTMEKYPENAPAWNVLGTLGGGRAGMKRYSSTQCYILALKADPEYVHAWNNLGYVGGGTVGGKRYSKAECYIRALQHDSSSFVAWNNLGVLGGGRVNSIMYSKVDCLLRGSDQRNSVTIQRRSLVRGSHHETDAGSCLSASSAETGGPLT